MSESIYWDTAKEGVLGVKEEVEGLWKGQREKMQWMAVQGLHLNQEW